MCFIHFMNQNRNVYFNNNKKHSKQHFNIDLSRERQHYMYTDLWLKTGFIHLCNITELCILINQTKQCSNMDLSRERQLIPTNSFKQISYIFMKHNRNLYLINHTKNSAPIWLSHKGNTTLYRPIVESRFHTFM